MTGLLNDYGLVVLFVLVALESFGIPLPGETALIAASVLAAQGHYPIGGVVAVAALAAIVGDNGGYWIGRTGGRRLLARVPILGRATPRLLPRAERFFVRHGAKTVFFGRFFSLLRVTAAWLAGISRMPWWRFLAWNAAGGVVWAVLVGAVAYWAGKAAAEAINRYGLYAGIALVAAALFAAGGFHLWKRRVLESG